jgi:hypothetical protein
VRTERELNEFIAHEVRNPLASAIAALSFVFRVQGALQDERVGKPCGMTFISSIQACVHQLGEEYARHSPLGFDNNIDEYRPTDILRDVFEPVASILLCVGAKVEIKTD